MGGYIPSTKGEREEMLKELGLKTVDELYAQIPYEIRVKSLRLPEGKCEFDVRDEMQKIARENRVFGSVFRGAGAYRHYIPSIVPSVVSKEEFVTAYTPYQAEMSQGILQAIFEYQTMICELMGMDAANASVYDGASAAAEATAMCRDRKRTKTLISAAANPMVIRTIETYCEGADAPTQIVPAKDGKTDLGALKEMLDGEVCCVYLQQPNYLGQIEDAEEVAKTVHEAGAKLIIGMNPIASALLKSPGEVGADVAVGEGQPLGMPLSFGGPYLGFMAATKEMTRKLPGRIVGETTDLEGKRAYVLTLQAREQHIRREKASSNLCSNQALCALTASVYLAAMGSQGLAQAAELCHSKAVYAAQKLRSIPGFSLRYQGEFFHEFITECPVKTETVLSRLEEHDILGGMPIDGGILWCVTEMNSKAQIDNLAEVLKEVAI